jgi:hypothetical protein
MDNCPYKIFLMFGAGGGSFYVSSYGEGIKLFLMRRVFKRCK